MSTLEVKPPYMTGAPGLTSWVRAMVARASAFCWARAPAIEAGAIAPDSVKGVTTTTWPAVAISTSPSIIGPSRRSGEEVLTTVNNDGSVRQLLDVDPAADADDFETVEDALSAERIGVEHLVRKSDEGCQAIEVPGGGREVDRFHRVAAVQMDDVEVLAELDQVGVVLEVAGAAPADPHRRNWERKRPCRS